MGGRRHPRRGRDTPPNPVRRSRVRARRTTTSNNSNVHSNTLGKAAAVIAAGPGRWVGCRRLARNSPQSMVLPNRLWVQVGTVRVGPSGVCSTWVASQRKRLADGGARGLSPSMAHHDRPSSTAAGRSDTIEHSYDNIVIDACPQPADLRRSHTDQETCPACSSYRHRMMVPIDRFAADAFMTIFAPVDVAPPSCLTVLSRSWPRRSVQAAVRNSG